MATEREIKLAATTTFRMPDLCGVLDGIAAAPPEPQRLWTRYFDTEDLRLARWGMSLRHRAGKGWTVKLLERPEITFSGNGGTPPPDVVDLVRAVVRLDELQFQAGLDTLRRRIPLHDADGAPVADIFDDEVSVLEGHRTAATFRELEVEVGETTPPDLVDALLDQLRRAGAHTADPMPKYIRALGPRASQPPEVPLPKLASGASAGDVVRRAIAASVIRLIEHDPVMRLDADPEGVHQARVATRRLRSDLRTFRSLIDPVWAADLRDELGWFAGILGSVRDGDVMLARIRRRAAYLPKASSGGAAHVLATLEAARDEAHLELLVTLRGERYIALLGRLVQAGNTPRLVHEADRPAAARLPGLVGRPWRALAKQVRALPDEPTDAELHAVRIRTKRVRYAAEAVAPVVGGQAWAFAAAAADLQDVLGDLNDAVVVENWLREWACGQGSVQGVFAAGELAGLERANAQRRRSRWRKTWNKLAARRLRSWM